MFRNIRVSQPSVSNAVALAWAAGLTDGDGCVHIAKQRFKSPRRAGRPIYRMRLTISQSNLVVLQQVQKILGINACMVQVARTTQQNRQAYNLVYDGRAAFEAVAKLCPYLVAKRAEALVLMAFARACRVFQHPGPLGQPAWIWKRREQYYKKLQRMK